MGGGWRGGGERRWKEAVLRGAEAQETHCGRRHERVQVKSSHTVNPPMMVHLLTAQLAPHRSSPKKGRQKLLKVET